jgi:predicted GNAT superfamily acetyltransferase
VSGVRIRELHRAGELDAVVEVARRTWQLPDRELPAAHDLLATVHAGGLVAGAFEDGELLGFVHGIPRTNLGEPCQHSNMLAVVPEARGRGLAARLKLFQRRFCLAHGIRLVTWTYDPLIVRNARLNLTRLRARAGVYLRDLYGALGGIYGSLPTDRFEVRWRLDAPEVVAAAAGRRFPERDLRDWPRPGGRSAGPRLAVEFPLGAPELYSRDPARALEARLTLRAAAGRLFARGYEATGLQVLPDRALYAFEQRRSSRRSSSGRQRAHP